MNFIKSKIVKYLMAITLVVAGFENTFALAVAPADNSNNLLNNALFWILLCVVLILLFFIISVSSVIKNITKTDLKKRKAQYKVNTTIVGIILLVISLFSGGVLNAQETLASSNSVTGDFFPNEFSGLSSGIFWIMVSAILFELFVLFILLIILRKMLRILGMVSDLAPEVEKPMFDFAKISATLNDAVPIERENEIMTDHVYDGIRELDNNLPPWWKYGFYLTIVIAIVYLFNYHVLRSSPLQTAEYQKELADAAIAKEEYLKTAADKVDESSVTVLVAANDLGAGKSIFKEKCVACHGQNGEGGVGPNFTDDYWINGGGVKNVFKTIKYGVPAKGMISWQSQLKPMEIQQIASYILSLRGSKPAGAKEPQGELYQEEGIKMDSTKTDTMKAVTAVMDSKAEASAIK